MPFLCDITNLETTDAAVSDASGATRRNHGWPARAGFRRGRLSDPETPVWTVPGDGAEVAFTLPAGTEIDRGEIREIGARRWMRVEIEDGRRGSILAESPVRDLERVRVGESAGILYSGSSPDSPSLYRLVSGDELLLLGSGEAGAEGRVRVRDVRGQEGYVDRDVPLLDPAAVSRVSAGYDVVVGGLVCLGGVVVTGLTYAAAFPSGGGYVVAWGAILFGGIRFLEGVVARRRRRSRGLPPFPSLIPGSSRNR